ncbi:MAG: phosphate ABC transporter substrate-binding protein PstS [Lentimicrobiaceae bacterium]|nr:phosphate ABC transporter substrate-binding protein PstS [Lentimicrobiaceae bacterium]
MKKAVLCLLIPMLLFSCGRLSSDKTKSGGVTISGAGATFPYPFYNIVFRDYMSLNDNIVVNYGAIGSGGGIRSLRDKSVDFGASDAFLTDRELESMNAPVIHIPTCMGGIVMAYTLSGVDSLRLTGSLISDIYLGNITRWNDYRIAAINPNVKLPDLEITPVYRSDGSGTTFNFSEYLCDVSPEWKKVMGMGKALKWDVGIAAKGNPGVAGIVQQTEGAIGYIGSEYSLTLGLPVAQLKNKAGNFVSASLESISAASKIQFPDDMRASIINVDNPDAYPMSIFTWLIVYQELNDGNHTEVQAQELVKLLSYIISPEGQQVAARINYAPLSEQAIEKTKALIGKITYNGEVLIPYTEDSTKTSLNTHLTTDTLYNER